jgi:hypothetical protein
MGLNLFFVAIIYKHFAPTALKVLSLKLLAPSKLAKIFTD